MLVHNIREAGLTPMSVADVMKGRIKAIESNDPAQMNLWLYNYILTTDGIGSYRGKLKVLHGFFNSIQPDRSKVHSCEYPSARQYKSFDGQEYPIDVEKAEFIFGEPKTVDTIVKLGAGFNNKEEAMNAPILLDLARDKHLLSDYFDAMHPEAEKLAKAWAKKYKEKAGEVKLLGLNLIDLMCAVEEERRRNNFGPVASPVGLGTIDNVHRTSEIYVESNLYSSHSVAAIAEDVPPQENLDKKVLEAARNAQPFELNGNLFVPVTLRDNLHSSD